MKIAIADNQALRFDREYKEHLEKNHEVKYECGANPELFKWCDVYYVNYWDNNIHYLWKWHLEHPEVKKPRIVCRAIDWEIWIGFVRDQALINWIDEAICIAPHLEEKLRKEANFGDKLHLIPLGIDMDKWTLIKEINKNVIMPINDIDWYLKHTVEGIKIFAELPKDWTMTIHGIFKKEEYIQKVVYYTVEVNNLHDRVKFDTAWVDDWNLYLDKFSFMLLPSMKEAFSYVTAQCAAKGIKPILNHWYGAERIWPQEWLYTMISKAVKMFETKEEPSVYRQVVIDRKYTNDRFFAEMDKVVLGI